MYSGKNNTVIYRSRTDIIAQILEAATTNKDDGVTKTRIMYGAYLSYTQLKEYISLLIQSGLLEYYNHNESYKTTERGMQFLQSCNQIGKYLAKSTDSKWTTIITSLPSANLIL